MRIAIACLLAGCIGDATAGNKPAYVDSLEQKYGDRIMYLTETAQLVVESFNIDCHSQDGRLLPLRNVLLARAASMHNPDMPFTTLIDSRNNQVRIFDVLTSSDGDPIYESLAMEINEWGELIPYGSITAEAILNSCFGSYGQIWKSGR